MDVRGLTVILLTLFFPHPYGGIVRLGCWDNEVEEMQMLSRTNLHWLILTYSDVLLDKKQFVSTIWSNIEYLPFFGDTKIWNFGNFCPIGCTFQYFLSEIGENFQKYWSMEEKQISNFVT
jgi:hypothetical protein